MRLRNAVPRLELALTGRPAARRPLGRTGAWRLAYLMAFPDSTKTDK